MGTVYVIADSEVSEEIKFLKIGFTSKNNDVASRLSALQTGNPSPLYIHCVYQYKTEDMAKQMEKLFHWLMKDHACSGEWFRANNQTWGILENMTKTTPWYFSGNPLWLYEDYSV